MDPSITIPDPPAVPPGAWLCPKDYPYPQSAPLITAAPKDDGSLWAYNEDEIVFLWTQILKIFIRLGHIEEDHVAFLSKTTGMHAGMNTASMRELGMSERVISLVERLPYAFENANPQRLWPALFFPEADIASYLHQDPLALAASREPHPAFSSQPSCALLRPDDVALLIPDESDGTSWILDTKANTIRTFWDISQYGDRTVPGDFVDEEPEEEHYRNWPAFHAPFVLKTYIRDLWDLKYLPMSNGHCIADTALFANAFLVARTLREDYGWPDAFRAEAWKRDRNRVEMAAEVISDEVTQVDPASPTASYSPNTNGFLLPVLFESGEYTRGANLINTLWGPMLDDIRTSSGASWEYVLHDGTPGLGLFTSLGHPWGGAATYVLTEWAAGLRAAKGIKGFGYKNWVVGPEAGVAMGLKTAHARIPTAFDGAVQVDWEVIRNDTLHVVIEAPAGTSGVFQYGELTKKLCGKLMYDFELEI